MLIIIIQSAIFVEFLMLIYVCLTIIWYFDFPYYFLFLQALVALKKGAQLLKYGRKGKPKFCPFRLSNVS